ncbi:MAG: hypothetical protein QOI54_2572 [Actinomycetota bacterium]|jgi:hypothetical protein|nr:hypothetical protein [Actinomycetota bacterium]
MTETTSTGSTSTDTSATDRGQWESRLDDLTREQEGRNVTIEVLDEEYGDAHEAEQLPFRSATYDRKDDVVVVAVGGRGREYPVVLRHMIWHPTEVLIDSAGGAPAVRVTEPDATVTLLTFFPDESSPR